MVVLIGAALSSAHSRPIGNFGFLGGDDKAAFADSFGGGIAKATGIAGLPHVFQARRIVDPMAGER